MATKKRNLSAYDKQVLANRQAEWAAANKLAQQQIEQNTATYNAQNAQTDIELAQLVAANTASNKATQTQLDQQAANNIKSYSQGISNLQANAAASAANAGNMRGSWAGDYVTNSAERAGMEGSKTLADQQHANAQTAFANAQTAQQNDYNNRLAAYELEKKRQGFSTANATDALNAQKAQQAHDLYAAEYYNYTPPKPKLSFTSTTYNPYGSSQYGGATQAMHIQAFSNQPYTPDPKATTTDNPPRGTPKIDPKTGKVVGYW